MTDEPVALDADRLIAIRDSWQITSRQIEKLLLSSDFTGHIMLNCLHSRVKNYVPSPSLIPEEEERRHAERRSAPRDGDDRRMA